MGSLTGPCVREKQWDGLQQHPLAISQTQWSFSGQCPDESGESLAQLVHQGIDLWKERERGREESGREGRGREGGREKGERKERRRGRDEDFHSTCYFLSLNTEVVHVHNKHFNDFRSDTNRFVADKSCTVADSIIALRPWTTTGLVCAQRRSKPQESFWQVHFHETLTHLTGWTLTLSISPVLDQQHVEPTVSIQSLCIM